MKQIRGWCRVVAVMFAVTLCLPFLNAPALAYSRIDVERETSLTVYFGDESTPFPGVPFEIYQVAQVSETARFTLTDTFAKYPITLDDLDSEGWRALAQTLEGFVTADGVEPFDAVQTNDQGRSVFPSLSTGLYLVLGEQYHGNGNTYIPEPFLISLPHLDQSSDLWKYDPVANVKFEAIPDKVETVNRKVLKVWEDNGAQSQRPAQITVQLLGDRQVYDTVTLGQENNWQHQWTGLDAKIQWSVVEVDVPEEYTVSVSQEGTTFVMTNTRPDYPGQPPEETLPPTGLYWWPVPVLACAGLTLFLIGWFRRNRRGNHEG